MFFFLFNSQCNIYCKCSLTCFFSPEGFTGRALNQTCTSFGFRMPANKVECEEIARQLSLPAKKTEMIRCDSKDVQYQQYPRCSYAMAIDGGERNVLRWNPSCRNEQHHHDCTQRDETLNLCVEG